MSQRRARAMRVQLRESATATKTRPQAAQLAEANLGLGALAAVAGTGRRYLARLIEGDRWGSSGYYPRAVLERDGPGVWPIGTLMYFDHPTITEAAERPERSVLNLAMRITSTPTYQNDGLYAEVEAFPHAAETVASIAEAAGLSIRAAGTVEHGEAGGRTGPIVTEITRGISVDLVTQAGAGGKLVRLLEAARTAPLREARTMGAWLESRLHLTLTQLADEAYGDGRLTREERITLSSAIGDGLAAWTARVEADAPGLFTRDLYDEPHTADSVMVAEAGLAETRAGELARALDAALTAAYVKSAGDYVWVCDHDPDQRLVWFSGRGEGGEHTFQQSYELDGDVIALTGEPIIVVARTEYEPVGNAGDAQVDTDDPAEQDMGPGDMPVTESAPAEAAGATTHVQDGTPPTSPGTPITEGSESVTTALTTGPAPGAAGTDATITGATVVTESVAPPAIDPARVAAMETQLAEATRRLDEQAAENTRLRAESVGRATVERLMAESTVPEGLRPLLLPEVTAAVLTAVPMTEAGLVDQAALDTRVTDAITAEHTKATRYAAANGVGTVQGLGESAAPATAVQSELVESYRARGLSEDAARLAAAGRP